MGGFPGEGFRQPVVPVGFGPDLSFHGAAWVRHGFGMVGFGEARSGKAGRGTVRQGWGTMKGRGFYFRSFPYRSPFTFEWVPARRRSGWVWQGEVYLVQNMVYM